MSSLSNKSSEEISELLDEYGIKHGPVVDSTRSLYEKKLKEAMAKDRKVTQSDKTFYREEEEEVTYVYRTPTRSDVYGDSGTYMRSRPEWSQRETSYSRARPEYGGRDLLDQPYMYDTPSTHSNSYSAPNPVKPSQNAPSAAKSSRLVPLWIQFVFFLIVAAFLYWVFSTMETNQSLKVLE